MYNGNAGLNHFAFSLKMVKAKFSRFLNVFGMHSDRDVVKNVACVFCADLQAELRDLCGFCHHPFHVIHLFPILFSSFCSMPFHMFRSRALSLYLFFLHTAAVEQTFF